MNATDLTMPVLGGDRVLVVDADEDSAAALTAVLRLNGFDAHAARTVAETLALLGNHTPHVTILDTDLPDTDWRKLARRLRSAATPPPALVVLTGDTDPSTKRAAAEAGAVAFLLKPAEPKELVKLLQNLCSDWAA